SSIFENSFSEELNRVIIHGILHLVGYNDKTEKEKEIMRKKEDYYINNFVI
ncbi:MAG: rRNA maturation RNase YbeY, partial [Flavobacteriales bacterium]|nr:rRNA maturation RNase YbeY [Flavobacteriales bacterium]